MVHRKHFVSDALMEEREENNRTMQDLVTSGVMGGIRDFEEELTWRHFWHQGPLGSQDPVVPGLKGLRPATSFPEWRPQGEGEPSERKGWGGQAGMDRRVPLAGRARPRRPLFCSLGDLWVHTGNWI